MARYLISDHHFGHANIIEYCDRPFTSVGEMDSVLLDRFYERVDPDDILIHLGDVAMDMRDGAETIERFSQLDGDLLIAGNHDVGLNHEEAPFPVVESCIIECDSHDDWPFYCTHRPADVPDYWDGWVIHGHIHNNDTQEHPFIHYDAQRVNVSAELLEYRPVALEDICELLTRCDNGTHLETIDAAHSWLEEQDDDSESSDTESEATDAS